MADTRAMKIAKLLQAQLGPNTENMYKSWALENRVPQSNDYDMRGYFYGNTMGTVEKPELNPADMQPHFVDTYKLPNHPTFSNESKYYRQGMKAGRWEGDNFVPIPAVAPLPIKMVPTNIAPVLQPNPTPIPVAVPMAKPAGKPDSIWGPGERYSLKDEKVRQMLKTIQKLKK